MGLKPLARICICTVRGVEKASADVGIGITIEELFAFCRTQFGADWEADGVGWLVAGGVDAGWRAAEFAGGFYITSVYC